MSIVIKRTIAVLILLIIKSMSKPILLLDSHFTALWPLYVTLYLICLPALTQTQRPVDTAGAFEQSKMQEKVVF